ncbi:hypothetical protein [Rossellomorea vietnamensis]|uniref:hypothetical protein n=1 Tax=Rossellomorea vietnamensis TaxID=218284 RepID=UPI000A91DF1C|nr:hypothetical protein [Rossellomorea vietnamensis]
MNMKEFPVADLSEDALNKVKSMESELCQQSAEDIVLIAYKNTEKSREGAR